MLTSEKGPVNDTVHSTSYYFLKSMNDIGVDYLFCNFGTDHAPLIEELARIPADAEPASVGDTHAEHRRGCRHCGVTSPSLIHTLHLARRFVGSGNTRRTHAHPQ